MYSFIWLQGVCSGMQYLFVVTHGLCLVVALSSCGAPVGLVAPWHVES